MSIIFSYVTSSKKSFSHSKHHTLHCDGSGNTYIFFFNMGVRRDVWRIIIFTLFLLSNETPNVQIIVYVLPNITIILACSTKR